MNYLCKSGYRIAIAIVATSALFSGTRSVAQNYVNLVSNGDMEAGALDADPLSPTFGQPFVNDWFRTNNGFEDLYVGLDARDGNQSIGYDTTGTPANQFIVSTWADWRSKGFRVESGEVFTWKFSYQIAIAAGGDPDGEIRAELRAWTGFNDATGEVNPSTFSNAGTEILLLNATGAINSDSGRPAPISVPRSDDSGWIDVSYEVTVPEADVVAFDLRFDNLFTTITIPFEGNFRLDDVQVLREVASIEGDYNNDGIVNLADYTVWRDQLGAFGNPGEVMGDGDDGSGTGTQDGVVDSSDYNFWKLRFGATTPMPGLSGLNAATVPEPNSLVVVVMLVLGVICSSRRK